MIAAEGPMPLDKYMNLCLGHPEFGYYMKGQPVGARGAFTTAPEISQMFGELAGAWCHAIWVAIGAPSKFYWVELGPGRGTLFADMLRVARLDARFEIACHGVLIDSSKVLQDQQRSRLKDSRIPLVWLTALDELPADAPLILVANEFFDALPIRQAVKAPGGWRERMIGCDPNGRLALGLSPQPLNPVLIPDVLKAAQDGAVYEFSPARSSALATVASRIRNQGGAALILDYGYHGPSHGDTFQAMRAHSYSEVLDAPGDADLTAHVDFQALAQSAQGVAVHGPLPQGAFLERLGISRRAERLKQASDPARRAAVEAALRRLTHKDEMGDLFKAMAICQLGLGSPPGFAS
jgi:NADH dehydrogenase [ubiquinone] 1 alpha subcomplex assembly factor 7